MIKIIPAINPKEILMRRMFSFLIGTLVGGLVGAVLALLFAPSSGTELRGQITERTSGIANEIRQAANTKRIELQQRLDTLRAPKQ
jgi:gas vesicle protein